MSSESSTEFVGYARECVRLAEQVDSPELREQLLRQAREWMQATMDEEDAGHANGQAGNGGVAGTPS